VIPLEDIPLISPNICRENVGEIIKISCLFKKALIINLNTFSFGIPNVVGNAIMENKTNLGAMKVTIKISLSRYTLRMTMEKCMKLSR